MADHSCRDCRELISAFIDGEASGEDNVRLRQHLAGCADCRATLDAYRKIGGSLKVLPAVYAPQHLTESIFARTIDAEPRRLFLITSRIGYSLAAVASLLLIFVVAAYLIIGGYQRGIDPTVTSSLPPAPTEPGQLVIWPLNQPIEITFNKQMNRESVNAALGMQPPREKERLGLTWDGNTLIIGGNEPFKPETQYEIKISTDATDKWGNPLKDAYQFGFTTSATLTTVQTPTPTATVEPAVPTQSAPSTATAQATHPATVETPADDDGATATPTAQGGDGTGPGTGSGTAVVPVDPIPPTPTTQPMPTPEPIDPIAEPEPTSTPTPLPTATEPVVLPTPTATPPPTATVTPPAPPIATASTPEPIPVIGAIGDVYWSDQTVQDRLGDPTAPASTFVTDQLEFQNGVMLLDQTGTHIYVLMFGAGWNVYPTPSQTDRSPEVGPDDGIFIPGGIFGELWFSEPGMSDEIGYALTEFHISFTGSVQTFEGGTMLATLTTVYVIYDGGAWDWFTYSAGT
ncbi:MAG: Ig-like domain-containing protein [Thermomicrobiales bacterium]